MKKRAPVTLVSLCVVGLLVAAACGGSGSSGDASATGAGPAPTGTGGNGAGGSGGASVGGASGGATSGCKTDAECMANAPATTPPGCAVGTCDSVAKRCVYSAPDKDGDNYKDANCKPLTAGLFQQGDDCNDADKNVHPNAWDGPVGDGHPDSCDRVDSDCNGTADDGKLSDGTTCACTLGETKSCEQDAGGNKINWPGGKPQGACKPGTSKCTLVAGKTQWGACVGAVLPMQFDSCSKAGNDENCNGVPNEGCTCTDGEVKTCGEVLGAKGTCAGGKTTCSGNKWGPCNIQPAAHDSCDAGNDDNCDGIPNDDVGGTVPWYYDGDGDGFASATAKVVMACGNPGNTKDSSGKYSNCADPTMPCPNQWTSSTTATPDCDDNDPTTYPGAWDGPMVGYGIQPPGFTMNVYANTTTEPAGEAPPPNPTTTLKNQFSIQFSWGARGVFLPDANGNNQVGQATNLVLSWSGTLVVPADGTYTFKAVTDDGVVLYVNHVKVLEDWQAQGPTPTTGTAMLTAGAQVPIVMHYFQSAPAAPNPATAQLFWSGPGFAEQPLTSWPSTVTTPQVDRCDGVKDNDCNKVVDDGVATDGMVTVRCKPVCVPGALEPCGTMMACANGVFACDSAGETWTNTQCIGQPTSCTCMPDPTIITCEQAVGAKGNCKSATTHCDSNGQWNPPCPTGAGQADSCDAGDDANCNGVPNEGCGACINGTGCGDPSACNGGGVLSGCSPGGAGSCSTGPGAGVPIGNACDVGNGVGACYQAGTWQCTGPSQAACVPGFNVPDSSFHTSPAPNGSWDWDCNDKIEVYYHVDACTPVDGGSDAGSYTCGNVAFASAGASAICGSKKGKCSVGSGTADYPCDAVNANGSNCPYCINGDAVCAIGQWHVYHSFPGGCGAALDIVQCYYSSSNCVNGASAQNVATQSCR